VNVSLTPELERIIGEKVASGLYKSASEVIREALRLLAERDELRELRKDRLRLLLDKGLAELDAGESELLDDSLREEIKRTGRQRLGSSE
jgi:antitoxin ParD1/3/4